MSKEELMELRKEIAFKRTAIDNKLDSSAYNRMSDQEVAELEEKYEKYEELIKKIDILLNNRTR